MTNAPLNIRLSHNKLCIISLAIAVFALYYKNLTGYWREDDTQILLHALNYSPWEYFFNPDVWHELSPSNLTPWVSLSFDMDLYLFGLTPFGFYLHHLISLFLVSTSSYLLLSLWVGKQWALTGTLLFLIGAPVETVTHYLMTRHYIEGLFFSIMAVYFFIIFLRQKKNHYLVIIVFFYVLAISAKEIYVPLIVLLLFMLRRKIVWRFKITIPYITPLVVVAILYIIWRHYMLSSMIGGYVDISDYLSFSYLQSVLITIGKIPALLAGKYWYVFFGIYFAAALFYFVSFREKLMIYFLSAILILLPLIPLVKFPGILAPDRYLLLPWYAICFSFTFFIGQLYPVIIIKHSKWFVMLILNAWLVMFAIIFIYSNKITESLDMVAIESDIQMRFAWENDKDLSFVPTRTITGSFWALTGLNKIKKILKKDSTSPGTIVDDIFLNNKSKLFEYDIRCHCMKDISDQVQKRIKHSKKTTRDSALSLFITNNKGLISWEYGPYKTGQYRVISKAIGSYHMSVTGSLKTNIVDPISFYLLYISLNGWRTYSPELTLYPDGSPLKWERHTK